MTSDRHAEDQQDGGIVRRSKQARSEARAALGPRLGSARTVIGKAWRLRSSSGSIASSSPPFCLSARDAIADRDIQIPASVDPTSQHRSA